MIKARDLCDVAEILNNPDPSVRYKRAAMWALHRVREAEYRDCKIAMSPELSKLADGYETYLERGEW